MNFALTCSVTHAHTAGMSSMIGLPSDRALAEDDECVRFILTTPSFHTYIQSLSFLMQNVQFRNTTTGLMASFLFLQVD